MTNENKYSLVNLQEYVTNLTISHVVYKFILQSKLNLSSLSIGDSINLGYGNSIDPYYKVDFAANMRVTGVCKLIGNVYVDYNVNISNNLSVRNNMYVLGNSYLYDLNVSNNTSLNNLNVSNNTSLNNLNVYGNSILNNGLNVNGQVTNINNGLITNTLDVKQNTSLNNTFINGTLNFGSNTSAIDAYMYLIGNFTFGINTPSYSNFSQSPSTVDLTAINAYTGITYDGPINIGQTTPNILNINASGNINYIGSMNLSGNLILNSPTNSISSILEIKTNNLTYFAIDKNGNTNISGNVVINNLQNSSYALDVNGNIQISNNINIGGNINSTSDIRVKENILRLNNCIDKIETISGYNYTRNDLHDKTQKHIGLIAQEVECAYPELVNETKYTKSINYQGISAILVECIKELNNRIKILENKILC